MKPKPSVPQKTRKCNTAKAVASKKPAKSKSRSASEAKPVVPAKVDRRRGNKLAPGAIEPPFVMPVLSDIHKGRYEAPGQPTGYKKEYATLLREYFTKDSFVIQEETTSSGTVKLVHRPVVPPTMARFAQIIGASIQTLWNWEHGTEKDGKTLKHPEFFEAVCYAHAAQQAIFMEGAILGHYNPFLSQFALKNYSGLKDKTEVDQNTTVSFPDLADLDEIYRKGDAAAKALNATVGK